MATNKDDYTPPARPSRDQIFTFFVYMFQSFLNPIILMRLLKHRLAESDPHETGNPFDWSVEPDKTSIRPLSGIAAVPPVRFATLKLITHWMEIFPEDFLRHGELGETVVAIVQRMNLVRGPYLPQMHRLRSLLGDLSRPRRDSSVSMEAKTRTPHHNNLQQLVSRGRWREGGEEGGGGGGEGGGEEEWERCKTYRCVHVYMNNYIYAVHPCTCTCTVYIQ